ncbi:phage tail assembly chaperone [Caulobacter flavus]|uniref:Phage tail assembly chaperone n=2 Tax=Caulobacter flavus TaxID=1679497 RepID=A0A2N5CS69_9CAUL|nr:phage tail assembly chaperone [Caulobacter flavus]AYV49509.1 phage tail assembly chaperone [Caulobacter flavus]PLR12829.1 phage tail assembly chaperone [Caulobacter flavus]
MLRRAAIEFAAPPDAFWRLSLKEWRALTGAQVGPALARPELAALMARFPDEEEADG